MSSSVVEGAKRIIEILQAAEHAFQADLCVHDFFQRAMLPVYWQWHHGARCARFRPDNFPSCKSYDGDEMHRVIANHPQGIIAICPFGLQEVAVPIISAGFLAGILFAGGFAELPDNQKEQRSILEEKKLLLLCVAEKIGRIMEGAKGDVDSEGQRRRREIMTWIEENMDKTPKLEELANRLHLSASRTGRVVHDLFLVSFTELIQTTKLNTAAYWLAIGEQSIGELSAKLGYCDQAYFSRLFSRHFGMNPLQYRKKALNREI